MNYSLEVVIIPVTDVDKSLAFYRDQFGFALDVDYAPSAEFRVVQLTPPGSSCSFQLGVGLGDAVPGSVRRLHLVVEDIEAARAELTGRGIEVGPVRHKAPIEDWRGGLADGVDEQRRDYASFVEFADPDGNTWVLQERGHRAS